MSRNLKIVSAVWITFVIASLVALIANYGILSCVLALGQAIGIKVAMVMQRDRITLEDRARQTAARLSQQDLQEINANAESAAEILEEYRNADSTVEILEKSVKNLRKSMDLLRDLPTRAEEVYFSPVATDILEIIHRLNREIAARGGTEG